MQIMNTNVYAINESIIRSKYPHVTKIVPFKQYGAITERDMMVAINLANVPSGTGHDSFLKGIITQADFIAPKYWWSQAQRYRRFDIISSQSQMHKILDMDIINHCPNTVSVRAIENAKDIIKLHKEGKVDFETVLDNLPQGMELGAGVSTNYLQLKIMFAQRKNHKLSDWSVDFVDWVRSLPHAMEFITCEIR